MKLIEVVVLLGAHCISPVQHADAVTQVRKVQCAVMVEQDTDTGRVNVTPREAETKPEAAAVLKRIAPWQCGANKCKADSAPQWYTTAVGKNKYRHVKAG